jgi:O-antigen ligase
LAGAHAIPAQHWAARPPRVRVFPHSTAGRYLSTIILLTGFYSLMSMVRIHSTSLMGFATILWGMSSAVLAMLIPQLRQTILIKMVWFLLFGAVLALDAYLFPIANPQVAIVLLTFLLIVYFSANYADGIPNEADSLLLALRRCTILETFLYAGVVILERQNQPPGFARAFSIAACVGLPALLIDWRNGNRKSLLWALIVAGVVLASLSRTATLCIFVLVPLSALGYGRRRRGNTIRNIIIVISGFVLFVVAMQTIPAFQKRFFYGKTLDQFLNGNAHLNTEGRDKMWAAVYDSWNEDTESRVLGKGLGTAGLVAESVDRYMLHPHNDYLRLLHDTGLLGTVLFTIGLLSALIGRFRLWRLFHRIGLKSQANVHGASFLSLIAFALMMSTDNPIDYLFAVTPVGVLLGLSIGYQCRAMRARVIR